MTGELLTDKKDKSEDFFKQYLDQLQENEPPDSAALYEKAQRESGIMEARQNVNNFQAQLNTITAQAEADQLSVTGQGRGITEPIILGQQAQIAREAAIKALPIAAQLSAAQGNLQLAEQHLETRFSLMKQDAQNRWEYKNKLFGAVYEFATAQEKKRIDQLKTEDDRQYEEHQDFLDVQNKLLLSAVTQNAPRAIVNAITSAQSAQEAITAAGQYGAQIPKASGSASNLADAVIAGITSLSSLSPTDRAAVSAQLVAKGFNSPTPPSWFKTQYQNQTRSSVTPEALQTAWDDFRQQILGGSSETMTDTQLKQELNKAISSAAFKAFTNEQKQDYIRSQGGDPADFGF
jgi:hypothetical protein